MNDGRILIFICRGQARRDIDALSASGEAEMARAVLRCKRFELNQDGCDILTSPTPDEKNSANFIAAHLGLDMPKVVDWLNDQNVQTHIIAHGFLGFSLKRRLIILVEKPVMIKIAAFFDLPSHIVQSGDIFILQYPQGKLEQIR